MQPEEILQKYIDSVPITTNESDALYVIGFVGLNGVGKSTVANMLAEKLNLHIASNDKIRKFLQANNFPTDLEEQALVEFISVKSTKNLLEKRVSHIIDADLIKFYKVAAAVTEEYGAKLFIMHIICPEQEVLKRLKTRAEQVALNPDASDSRATEVDYFSRKALHEKLPEDLSIFGTIDTSKELESQINSITQKIKGNI